MRLDPSQIIYKFTPAATSKYESVPTSTMIFLDIVRIRLSDCDEKLLSTADRNLIAGLPVTLV